MRVVSKSDAVSTLSALIDETKRQAVSLEENGERLAVLISPEDYEIVRKAKIEKLLATCDEAGRYAKEQGLTEDILQELLAKE